MGNSKSKFTKGNMLVQTEKSFYYPGEMVTGTIGLRTSAPI